METGPVDWKECRSVVGEPRFRGQVRVELGSRDRR